MEIKSLVRYKTFSMTNHQISKSFYRDKKKSIVTTLLRHLFRRRRRHAQIAKYLQTAGTVQICRDISSRSTGNIN